MARLPVLPYRTLVCFNLSTTEYKFLPQTKKKNLLFTRDTNDCQSTGYYYEGILERPVLLTNQNYPRYLCREKWHPHSCVLQQTAQRIRRHKDLLIKALKILTL